MRKRLLSFAILLGLATTVVAQDDFPSGVYFHLNGGLFPDLLGQGGVALTVQGSLGYQFNEWVGLGLGAFAANHVSTSTGFDFTGLGLQYRLLTPNHRWLAQVETGLITSYGFGTDVEDEHFYIPGFDPYGKIILSFRPGRQFTLAVAYTYISELKSGWLEYNHDLREYFDEGRRGFTTYHLPHFMIGLTLDSDPPVRRRK